MRKPPKPPRPPKNPQTVATSSRIRADLSLHVDGSVVTVPGIPGIPGENPFSDVFASAFGVGV